MALDKLFFAEMGPDISVASKAKNWAVYSPFETVLLQPMLLIQLLERYFKYMISSYYIACEKYNSTIYLSYLQLGLMVRAICSQIKK